MEKQQYGNWLVLEVVKGGKRKCKCLECNETVKVVPLYDLKNGKSVRCKACGLKRRSKTNSSHGMSKTRFYSIWSGIKKRCNKESYIDYHRYGGRGITYQESWEKFENFYADMFEGYSDDLTIERIDLDGNYTKENCKWITPQEQFANKSTTKFIEYNGETKPLFIWCQELGLDYTRTKQRLLKGYSVEVAFNPDNLKSRNEDGTFKRIIS